MRPEQLVAQPILQPVVVHRLLDVVSILSTRTAILQRKNLKVKKGTQLNRQTLTREVL